MPSLMQVDREKRSSDLKNLHSARITSPSTYDDDDMTICEDVISYDEKTGSTTSPAFKWINAIRTKKLMRCEEGVNLVAFSPDNKIIATSADDSQVELWNLETGKVVLGPLNTRKYDEIPIAFSPDGKQIAFSTKLKTIQVWDIESKEMAVESTLAFTGHISCVVYSYDGDRIAAGCDDGSVYVLDAVTGVCLYGPFRDKKKTVKCLAFSPDGTRIAYGSADKAVRVWNLWAGHLIAGPLKGSKKKPKLLAFSEDGHSVVCGTTDRQFHAWDVRSGGPSSPSINTDVTLLSQLFSNHGSTISVSPDGRWVATGRSSFNIFKVNEIYVRIWDTQTGELVTQCNHVCTPPSTGTWLNSVAFSPDGDRVVAGYLNGEIVVYKLGYTFKQPV